MKNFETPTLLVSPLSLNSVETLSGNTATIPSVGWDDLKPED